MDTRQLLAIGLDPGAILRAHGFTVDQLQTDVLLSRDRQLLLNRCRQDGTSAVVSAAHCPHLVGQAFSPRF
jgi:hypothetical protein